MRDEVHRPCSSRGRIRRHSNEAQHDVHHEPYGPGALRIHEWSQAKDIRCNHEQRGKRARDQRNTDFARERLDEDEGDCENESRKAQRWTEPGQ